MVTDLLVIDYLHKSSGRACGFLCCQAGLIAGPVLIELHVGLRSLKLSFVDVSLRDIIDFPKVHTKYFDLRLFMTSVKNGFGKYICNFQSMVMKTREISEKKQIGVATPTAVAWLHSDVTYNATARQFITTH